MQLTARSLFIGSFVLVLGGLAGGFWLSRQQPGLFNFGRASASTAKPEPRAIEPRTNLGSGEQGTIRLFEESSPSVAYITSLALQQEYYSGNVTQIPVGTGTGILAFAAAMSVFDNSMNYSINQSAKETLYTPTPPEIIYKAKAFIDMFVQRFSKVLSVVLNLAFVAFVAENVRWLSLVTLGLVSGWYGLITYLGIQFKKRAKAAEEK